MKSSSSSRAPCKTVSLTCTVGQLWSYTSRTLTFSGAHFLCVCTFFDGPQRAAQDRSCSASQAATTAFMVATRAAVDRCGPWQRRCTTPHEDRRRLGPGRRRASCTARTRTGRLLLPSQCSSACTKKSPSEGGLPAWQGRRGRRSGYSDTPWSSLPTSLLRCPLLLYLSRRWWTTWWP